MVLITPKVNSIIRSKKLRNLRNKYMEKVIKRPNRKLKLRKIKSTRLKCNKIKIRFLDNLGMS